MLLARVGCYVLITVHKCTGFFFLYDPEIKISTTINSESKRSDVYTFASISAPLLIFIITTRFLKRMRIGGTVRINDISYRHRGYA